MGTILSALGAEKGKGEELNTWTGILLFNRSDMVGRRGLGRGSIYTLSFVLGYHVFTT